MPETYGTGPEYMNSPHVSLIKAQPHSPTQEGETGKCSFSVYSRNTYRLVSLILF